MIEKYKIWRNKYPEELSKGSMKDLHKLFCDEFLKEI